MGRLYIFELKNEKGESILDFKSLHHQAEPLLVCNVWNADTAQCAEKAGFSAIATSSAAIAHSLGYEDGEDMTFLDLLFVVKKIKRKTTLPLSVDIESGYSRDPEQIVEHIVQLHEVGVVGVNIEDSVVVNGERSLMPQEEFAQVLSVISKRLRERGVEIFINVRTDPFLIGIQNPVNEVQKRICCYERYDVDGIFIPGISCEHDIVRLVLCTTLPVNVLALPTLTNLRELKLWGVKRVSMGNWMYDQHMSHYNKAVLAVKKDGNLNAIFL